MTATHGRETTRPKTRRGPARIELRVWLDAALHERVLREAVARGGSASKAVRDGMHEYFALKDDLTSALGGRGPAASTLSHPTPPMSEEHASHDRKLDAALQRLSVLACMLDQAYQGIIGRMNDVPAQLRAQRAAVAEESAQRWRSAVARLIRHQGYRWLDELSEGED